MSASLKGGTRLAKQIGPRVPIWCLALLQVLWERASPVRLLRVLLWGLLSLSLPVGHQEHLRLPSRGYKDRPAPSSLSLSMPGSWGLCCRPCWRFHPPATYWPLPSTFVLLSVGFQPNKVVICFSIRFWVLESHCVASYRAWVVTGPNTSLINWPIYSQCHLCHTWAMFWFTCLMQAACYCVSFMPNVGQSLDAIIDSGSTIELQKISNANSVFSWHKQYLIKWMKYTSPCHIPNINMT